jgi:hypothetical protein
VRVVRLLKERSVDLVKVHNFTTRDAFFAIADEALRQKLSFASHIPLKVTIEEAVDAGISSIEHLSEDGRVWKACSGRRPRRNSSDKPHETPPPWVDAVAVSVPAAELCPNCARGDPQAANFSQRHTRRDQVIDASR